MRIKKERKTEFFSKYYLRFTFKNEPGRGFSFDCDKDGRVDVGALPKAAQVNYHNATQGPLKDILCLPEVEEIEYRHTSPGVGVCDCCGKDVELYGFTNTCNCGADYNMSGQLLADRSQWGEETGESYSDIVNGGYNY